VRLADEGLLVPVVRERDGVLECDPAFLVPERARVEPDFLWVADLGVLEPLFLCAEVLDFKPAFLWVADLDPDFL
jgi:hypothetical protein